MYAYACMYVCMYVIVVSITRNKEHCKEHISSPINKHFIKKCEYKHAQYVYIRLAIHDSIRLTSHRWLIRYSVLSMYNFLCVVLWFATMKQEELHKKVIHLPTNIDGWSSMQNYASRHRVSNVNESQG